VRLVESAPVPPLLVGAAIAAGVLLLCLVAEAAWGDLAAIASGERSHQKVGDYVFSLVLSLFAGYVPAAHSVALSSQRHAFDALRPALRGTGAELSALRAEVTRFDAGALRAAGAWGVGVSLLVPLLVDQSLGAYRIGEFNAMALVHRLLLPLIGWMIGRFGYVAMVGSGRLAGLAERMDVDLLDLSPLAPLVRHGLRNALLYVGVVSITLLLATAWGTRPGLAWVLAGGLALSLALGAMALLVPVRGAHAVIREAKRAELAWCNRAIRRRRDALRAGSGASDAAPLVELVGYRNLVDSVREWPVDASTLTRFALYLAIPVGSWLGGALVERLVNALLD
jgi:hypothetical protein